MLSRVKKGNLLRAKARFAHNKGGTIMIINEYIQFVLEVKKEAPFIQTVDEATAYEAAQAISGSFTYLLL